MDAAPASTAAPVRERAPGIDLARGLAVVLMIQTHAYDAWVRPAARASAAYGLTRVLGAIPAPLFLLLAGVGLGLSWRPGASRSSAARRGLEVVGYGYLVSLIYAVLDWSFVLADLLRADILHCIGLSLVVCSWLVVGRGWQWALGVIVVANLVGPLLHGPVDGHKLPAGLGPVLGLLVDVVPYTRFPLLPLVGFTALGVVLAPALRRFPWRAALIAAAACAALAAVFHAATAQVLAALGGRLSRSHPAAALNFVDGAARALAVVSLGCALGPAWPWAPLRVLVLLGRRSLFAYAVHIPLCYGSLGRPLWHRLGMAGASLGVVALCLLTYGLCRARDAVGQKR